MKGLEDMQFYCDIDRIGKFIGRVREFDDLRTRPHGSRLDALNEIVGLTSQRVAEIDSNRNINRKIQP